MLDMVYVNYPGCLKDRHRDFQPSSHDSILIVYITKEVSNQKAMCAVCWYMENRACLVLSLDQYLETSCGALSSFASRHSRASGPNYGDVRNDTHTYPPVSIVP